MSGSSYALFSPLVSKLGALVVFLASITAIIAYFLVTVYKLEEQLEYELGKDNLVLIS